MADVLAYLARGGAVVYPLIGLSALLWFLVGLRIVSLRSIAQLLTDGHPGLGVSTREAQADLRRYRRTIRVVVAVAPLLGLLGTVDGMVDTFMALNASPAFREEGVSGGISEALITTQLGLLVAIPGLFVSRVLDQRERRLSTQLETPSQQPSIATAAVGAAA